MIVRRAKKVCRIASEMGNETVDKVLDVMKSASSDLNVSGP